MIETTHVTEAGRMLVRLTGLWEGTTRAGDRYFAGSLSETARLLVFANDAKAADSDPDWFVYVGDRAGAGGLFRVGRLWTRHSRRTCAAEEYLSGSCGYARLLVFTNGRRSRDAEPTHVAYLAPKDPPPQTKGEAAAA